MLRLRVWIIVINSRVLLLWILVFQCVIKYSSFTGLTIAIVRGFTNLKYMEHSWEAEKVCYLCNLLRFYTASLLHWLGTQPFFFLVMPLVVNVNTARLKDFAA